MQLFLATSSGLLTAVSENSGWRIQNRALPGRHVSSVIAREGVILAGTSDGIFRSADGGQSWAEASRGLAVRRVRWLAFHPGVSDCEFAGTEPAALFVSNDGGGQWQARPEVNSLRDELGWWLPYSPEAGCVRGFAFHGPRAYAAVEVGGVLRSNDTGATWTLANGRSQPIHPDVHSIAVHPSSPDAVFAPTGGGYFASQDGGESWQALYAHCYVRAVWVHPQDPARQVLGPSEGPSGANGRIEITHDGGQTWQRTAVGWPRNMVERFKPVGNSLFAVLANGELLQAPLPAPTADLAALDWTAILPDAGHIHDVTAMAV